MYNSEKTNQSEISLRFKIRTKIQEIVFYRMKDFLSENTSASIEQLSCNDFEFISVSLILVAVKGLGWSINSEVSCQSRIGLEV